MMTTVEAGPADTRIISEHLSAVLDELGMAIGVQPGLDHTPERWAKALIEMTSGMWEDPARWLTRTFPPETEDPGMVIVPGITFSSLCEHHMMPFAGTIVVGYLPQQGGQIVGLSKIPRMVLGFAARPSVQERLGSQIIGAIMDSGIADGAGCVVDSVHTCMTARGVRAHGASMRTSHLAGKLRTDPPVRAEFFTLALGTL